LGNLFKQLQTEKWLRSILKSNINPDKINRSVFQFENISMGSKRDKNLSILSYLALRPMDKKTWIKPNSFSEYIYHLLMDDLYHLYMTLRNGTYDKPSHIIFKNMKYVCMVDDKLIIIL